MILNQGTPTVPGNGSQPAAAPPAQSGQGGEGDSGKTARELELERLLSQNNSAATKNQVIVEMMKDPDFAAFYQAKAAGKKFKLVTDEGDGGGTNQPQPGQQQQNQPVAPPDFENMTEAQKMNWQMEQITKNLFSQLMPALNQQMTKVIDPINQKIGSYDQFIQQQQLKAANDEVARTAAKYPDFSNYADAMLKLSDTFPKASAEQLYFLARQEAGQLTLPETHTESERPMSMGARAAGGSSRQPAHEPIAPGVQGMRNAIRAAAQKTARSIGSHEWGE